MTDETQDTDQSATEIEDAQPAEEQPNEISQPRSTTTDPLFGLLIAVAIAFGSMPLAGADADLRYTLTWGLLIGFSVLAWLIGNFPRIGEEKPENLAWGVALGLVLGIPLLAFGSGILQEMARRIWSDFPPGTALTYLIFIMPMAETLFFRGIMQETRAFWEVSFVATLWGLVLFFPHINAGPLPLITGIVLIMVNTLYGYVRMRNGLAAAWLCQITVNILILFFPFV